MNKLERLRDNWGLFIGEIMRLRKVAAGLLTPAPNIGRCAGLPALTSTGPDPIFTGEPSERSNAVALEFLCLTEGQISSLCPGVAGVKIKLINQLISLGNKI